MQNYQHYQPSHMTLEDRCFPHRLIEGVWIWSVFSEEKELYFNGYLIETIPGQSIIVDPPCGGPEVLEAFTPLPKPELVIITNRDHERETEQFRKHFGIPVCAPELDSPSLSNAPDKIYGDGELFPGGWQAIQLLDQKSPGECALYQPNRRVLILGDALIGKPFQRLSMLPSDKYTSRQGALQGLRKLQKLDVETVLPCDGDPLVQHGAAMITEALLENTRELEQTGYGH